MMVKADNILVQQASIDNFPPAKCRDERCNEIFIAESQNRSGMIIRYDHTDRIKP